MANRYLSLEDRFWAKVDTSNIRGCWEWTGKKSDGYGSLRHNNRYLRASRVSWLLEFGELDDDQFVLHKCDNPACVNPKHLFLGDQKANMKDMNSKGRGRWPGPTSPAYGESHGMVKLTREQVEEIRKRYTPRNRVGALAREFGITRSHLWRIALGENWKK